jgi:hypothetical protein
MVNICCEVSPEIHAKLRYIMVAQGYPSLRQLLKHIVEDYVRAYYESIQVSTGRT